ncbi:unnamed protein product, partial [Pylaiella littoralis]
MGPVWSSAGGGRGNHRSDSTDPLSAVIRGYGDASTPENGSSAVSGRARGEQSLLTVMKDPHLCTLFEGWLEDQSAEGLLKFWMECDGYSSNAQRSGWDLQNLRSRGLDIYTRYMEPGCLPNSLGLDAETCKEIAEIFKPRGKGLARGVHRKLFREKRNLYTAFHGAMRKTFYTLLLDYLPDFLSSKGIADWQDLATFIKNSGGGVGEGDGAPLTEEWGLADVGDEFSSVVPAANAFLKHSSVITHIKRYLAGLQVVDAGRGGGGNGSHIGSRCLDCLEEIGDFQKATTAEDRRKGWAKQMFLLGYAARRYCGIAGISAPILDALSARDADIDKYGQDEQHNHSSSHHQHQQQQRSSAWRSMAPSSLERKGYPAADMLDEAYDEIVEILVTQHLTNYQSSPHWRELEESLATEGLPFSLPSFRAAAAAASVAAAEHQKQQQQQQQQHSPQQASRRRASGRTAGTTDKNNGKHTPSRDPTVQTRKRASYQILKPRGSTNGIIQPISPSLLKRRVSQGDACSDDGVGGGGGGGGGGTAAYGRSRTCTAERKQDWGGPLYLPRNQGSFRSGVSKLEPLVNPPTVKTLGPPLTDDSDAGAPAGGTATSGSNVDGGGGSGEGKSGYGGIIQGGWARQNKKPQHQHLQSLNESSMSPGLEYMMEEEVGRRRRAYSADGHELGVDGRKHARGENSSFQHSRYLRNSDSSIGDNLKRKEEASSVLHALFTVAKFFSDTANRPNKPCTGRTSCIFGLWPNFVPLHRFIRADQPGAKQLLTHPAHLSLVSGTIQAGKGRILHTRDRRSVGDLRGGAECHPSLDDGIDIHTLLEDSLGLSLFRRHSRELFQEENISLWVEIRDFRTGEYAVPHMSTMLEVDEGDSIAAIRARRARIIYETYISENAEEQVNLSSKLRETARKNVEELERVAAAPNQDDGTSRAVICALDHGDAFDDVQREMLHLIESNLWVTFRQSKRYEFFAAKFWSHHARLRLGCLDQLQRSTTTAGHEEQPLSAMMLPVEGRVVAAAKTGAAASRGHPQQRRQRWRGRGSAEGSDNNTRANDSSDSAADDIEDAVDRYGLSQSSSTNAVLASSTFSRHDIDNDGNNNNNNKNNDNRNRNNRNNNSSSNSSNNDSNNSNNNSSTRRRRGVQEFQRNLRRSSGLALSAVASSASDVVTVWTAFVQRMKLSRGGLIGAKRGDDDAHNA